MHQHLFARGLSQRPTGGWRLSVRVNGKLHQQSLKASVPVENARLALKDMRAKLRAGSVSEKLRRFEVPLRRSVDGWCYVYVVQQGPHVKIGRAIDIPKRLESLRTGSALALTLLAAVPAHADLEQAIHERFKHLRVNGEWFEFAPDLGKFIARLQNGENPVALLWE